MTEPKVFVQNSSVYTESRDVAEYFGKRHGNVLRKIEALIKEMGAKFTELNFELSDYQPFL